VAPVYRNVPMLTVPEGLVVAPDVRSRHDDAWRRLQSGDLRGAHRDFTEALRRAPQFYPASAGLGYVAMLERRLDEAAEQFDAAIAADQSYLPALSGRLDVALALDDDEAAVGAAELILAVDPGREEIRSQYEVLRLRVVQAHLSEASTARTEGRWDDAQAALDTALVMVPDSAVVLRELARVEIDRGRLDEAEAHASRSLLLDAGDAEAHVVMASVLEAHGRLREAADALARAMAINPRAEWRDRATALRARADFNTLPEEYRTIASATTVTRGQVAAMLGIRISGALAQVPRRVTVVLTDVRAHWAATWILPVTRAGWMESFANHTFQPSAPVRRAELAQIVWRVTQDLAQSRPQELAAWRASRPTLPDVPRSHLSYSAIAGALASGAMGLLPGDRFEPNRMIAGSELVAAVARLEQLAKQRP
jgi:Tfp pilus assembly protein PilF